MNYLTIDDVCTFYGHDVKKMTSELCSISSVCSLFI